MKKYLAMRKGTALVPVDSEGVELVNSLPLDKPVSVQVSVPRNIKFHRKAFALIKLTHQYWQPKTLVSNVEKQTVIKLGSFLIDQGIAKESVSELCRAFLKTLNANREGVEMQTSFDAFRDWVTVESGFFNIVITPAGPRKEPKSWSFAKMDDAQFADLYQQIFNVCWKLVLSTKFTTPDEAEAAAEEVLRFDS